MLVHQIGDFAGRAGHGLAPLRKHLHWEFKGHQQPQYLHLRVAIVTFGVLQDKFQQRAYAMVLSPASLHTLASQPRGSFNDT